MATLICPHCGMANRAGANFCNNCGADLRAETIPLPANVEPTSPADSSRQTSAPPADEAPARDAASSATPPVDPWVTEQPWLRDEDAASPPVGTPTPASAASAAESSAGESSAAKPPPPPAGRTITGVQGLLPPLNLSRQPTTAPTPVPLEVELTAAQAEDVRYLMRHAPTPFADAIALPDRPTRTGLRMPWLIGLLALAVALPLLLLIDNPVGAPRQWPGVQEAYVAIENLPRDATALIYWAYDPATSGELDLVALPVTQHLLNRQANLAVVSLLPGGPATARRLIAQALYDPADAPLGYDAERLQIADQTLLANEFLPGGVAALTLLGQAPSLALGGVDSSPATLPVGSTVAPPTVAVIMAAQAEDVQYWLEQVQPLNGLPVIAVTAAGADPPLRPYLDSGQLTGLVSGFDGAYSYDRLTTGSRPLAAEARLRIRLAAQNWGQITLLAIILLGNLAGLLGRRPER